MNCYSYKMLMFYDVFTTEFNAWYDTNYEYYIID